MLALFHPDYQIDEILGAFLRFLSHPLLPAVFIGIAAVLLARVGGEYGLTYLVRSEKPFHQFWNGVALTALCGKTIIIGYLLETLATPDYANRPAFRSMNMGPLITYALGLVMLISIAILCVGVVNGRRRHRPTPRIVDGKRPVLPMIAGVGFTLVLFVIALAAPDFWPWLETAGEAIGRKVHDWGREFAEYAGWQWKTIHPNDYYAHGMITVSSVLTGSLYAGVYWFRWRASAVVVVCFFINMIVAIYGYLSFYKSETIPVVIIAVLVLAALLNISLFSRRFPKLRFYKKPVSLADYGDAAQEELPQYRQQIKTKEVKFGQSYSNEKHPEGKKRPLVLICVSGGGMSASAWALAVMHRLEEQFRAKGIHFPYHVRLVAGASGGMVGAGCYVADLPDPATLMNTASNGRHQHVENMYHKMAEDCLSPVITQMVYGDLIGALLPIPGRYDRGQELEAAWGRNLASHPGDNPLGKSFGSLEDGERQGWRPSLVYSPMLVEDGRRLLISNLDLGKLAANCGNTHEGVDRVLSRGAFELFRLFPYNEAVSEPFTDPKADPKTNSTIPDPEKLTKMSFTIGMAARMSASFPFLSPAVPLPTQPRRRPVDAGYFDNFGVGVATGWLVENRDWVQQHASGVALIQIRAYPKLRGSQMIPETLVDGSTRLTRAVELLTAPLEAVINMRRSAAIFRNDEAIELISHYFNELRLKQFITRFSEAQLRAIANAIGLKHPRELRLQAHDMTEAQNTDLNALVNMNLSLTSADVQVIKDYLSKGGQPLYFTNAILECSGDASVSWYLTPEERQRIWDEAHGQVPNAQAPNAQAPNANGLQQPRANDAFAADPTIDIQIGNLIKWWEGLPNDVAVDH